MSRELVLDRAVGLLVATTRHIDAHIAAYADREDVPGTRLLLETLHKISEDALSRVIAIQRELEERSLTPKEYERQLREVQMIARNTARLTGQPLHYVTKAHGRTFDPIASAYSRLAHEIEPKTELIFRGSEHRGYALSVPLLGVLTENLINRGSELVEQIELLPSIVYLQYPAVAEGDVLQHLLIGHEVAHLALRRPVDRRTTAEDRFEKALRAVGGDDLVELEPSQTATEDRRKERRQRALRWFTEIACDVLAVRLVGPAYYVALCEHAFLRQWFYRPSDDETVTHPHLAWRLNRAHRELERFFAAMDGPLRQKVEALIEPYAAAVPDHAETIEAEPYRTVMGQALDALTTDLDGEELIGQAALSPDQLAKELPAILGQLDAGLAPAECIDWTVDDVLEWKDGCERESRPWSRPFDWRSILNGGYFHLLEDAAAPEQPLRRAWGEVVEGRDRLVNHLRGTVELSEFHRAAAEVEKLGMLETRLAA